MQKRCIRILFGESYSFDHQEYYATCCRTKTYQEHVALKNYALEHTKPLFNKHSLLTLHNLYVSRSLVELIKILKLHLPYPVYENLQFCPRTHHFRLLSRKYNLDISKNNYFISSVNLWNEMKIIFYKPVQYHFFNNNLIYNMSSSYTGSKD